MTALFTDEMREYQRRRRAAMKAGTWRSRADRALAALTKAKKFGIASPELTDAEREQVRRYYRDRRTDPPAEGREARPSLRRTTCG